MVQPAASGEFPMIGKMGPLPQKTQRGLWPQPKQDK
jgi:hypothetical protein